MSTKKFGYHSPTKAGNWGDWATIEYDRTPHKVSCATCKYYSNDKSCSKKGVYVPEIGYDFWKHCSSFELKDTYANPEFVESVRKVKGSMISRKDHYTEKPQPTAKPQVQSSTSKKPKLINCSLNIGLRIYNDKYGKGRFISFDKATQILSVEFDCGVKKFYYPDAFFEGKIKTHKAIYKIIKKDSKGKNG